MLCDLKEVGVQQAKEVIIPEAKKEIEAMLKKGRNWGQSNVKFIFILKPYSDPLTLHCYTGSKANWWLMAEGYFPGGRNFAAIAPALFIESTI